MPTRFSTYQYKYYAANQITNTYFELLASAPDVIQRYVTFLPYAAERSVWPPSPLRDADGSFALPLVAVAPPLKHTHV